MQTLSGEHDLSVKKMSDLVVGRGSFNASAHSAQRRKKNRVYKDIKLILEPGQGSHIQKLKAIIKIDLH